MKGWGLTPIVLVAIVCTQACVVPDVGAFQQASHEVYSTTERVSYVFDRDVGAIEFGGAHSIEYPPGSGVKLSGDLETLFDKVWTPHVEATLAMASYADALAELAGSPRSGGGTVRKLADSVSEAFGTVAGGALPNGVSQAAQTIVTAVADWKAASDLYKAVDALDADIQGFAETLEASYRIVGDFIENLEVQVTTLELQDPEAKPTIDRIVAYERELAQYRATEPSKVDEKRAAQLSLIQQDLAVLREERRGSRFQRARRSLRKLNVLVQETEEALSEWAAEHGRIKSVLEEDRTLSAPRLLEKCQRLSELYKDVKTSLESEALTEVEGSEE